MIKITSLTAVLTGAKVFIQQDVSVRTLVVLDDWAMIETHSQFFKHLTEDLGHSVTYKMASDDVQLKMFQSYHYHNLILMTPSIKGKNLN